MKKKILLVLISLLTLSSFVLGSSVDQADKVMGSDSHWQLSTSLSNVFMGDLNVAYEYCHPDQKSVFLSAHYLPIVSTYRAVFGYKSYFLNHYSTTHKRFGIYGLVNMAVTGEYSKYQFLSPSVEFWLGSTNQIYGSLFSEVAMGLGWFSVNPEQANWLADTESSQEGEGEFKNGMLLPVPLLKFSVGWMF